MQYQPDRHGEQRDSDEPIPCPWQLICFDGALHREDGDHEIVRETRVAEEASVFRESLQQAADESDQSEHQHDGSDREIDGRHRVEFHIGDAVEFDVGINPLRARPEKAEPGLDRGAIAGFRRRHLADDQAEIQRHNAPDQFQMLERRADQLGKNSPKVLDHPAGSFDFNR